MHLHLKRLDVSQRQLLRAHVNCLNTYISETHIARYLKNCRKMKANLPLNDLVGHLLNIFLGKSIVCFAARRVSWLKIPNIQIDGGQHTFAKRLKESVDPSTRRRFKKRVMKETMSRQLRFVYASVIPVQPCKPWFARSRRSLSWWLPKDLYQWAKCWVSKENQNQGSWRSSGAPSSNGHL